MGPAMVGLRGFALLSAAQEAETSAAANRVPRRDAVFAMVRSGGGASRAIALRTLGVLVQISDRAGEICRDRRPSVQARAARRARAAAARRRRNRKDRRAVSSGREAVS